MKKRISYLMKGVYPYENFQSNDKRLEAIFFPYCTEEESRVKAQEIYLAYYCSLDTLFNILLIKKLWLRNIRCMNDYQELYFGYNTLKAPSVRIKIRVRKT